MNLIAIGKMRIRHHHTTESRIDWSAFNFLTTFSFLPSNLMENANELKLREIQWHRHSEENGFWAPLFEKSQKFSENIFIQLQNISFFLVLNVLYNPTSKFHVLKRKTQISGKPFENFKILLIKIEPLEIRSDLFKILTVRRETRNVYSGSANENT